MSCVLCLVSCVLCIVHCALCIVQCLVSCVLCLVYVYLSFSVSLSLSLALPFPLFPDGVCRRTVSLCAKAERRHSSHPKGRLIVCPSRCCVLPTSSDRDCLGIPRFSSFPRSRLTGYCSRTASHVEVWFSLSFLEHARTLWVPDSCAQESCRLKNSPGAVRALRHPSRQIGAHTCQS